MVDVMIVKQNLSPCALKRYRSSAIFLFYGWMFSRFRKILFWWFFGQILGQSILIAHSGMKVAIPCELYEDTVHLYQPGWCTRTREMFYWDFEKKPGHCRLLASWMIGLNDNRKMIEDMVSPWNTPREICWPRFCIIILTNAFSWLRILYVTSISNCWWHAVECPQLDCEQLNRRHFLSPMLSGKPWFRMFYDWC